MPTNLQVTMLTCHYQFPSTLIPLIGGSNPTAECEFLEPRVQTLIWDTSAMDGSSSDLISPLSPVTIAAPACQRMDVDPDAQYGVIAVLPRVQDPEISPSPPTGNWSSGFTPKRRILPGIKHINAQETNNISQIWDNCFGYVYHTR